MLFRSPAAVNTQQFLGKSLRAVYIKLRQDFQKRLAALSSLNKEKPRRGLRIFADKPQGFRLNIIFSHGGNNVRKPFGTVAKAELSAEFQQSFRRPANVVNVAEYLMPRDALCFGKRLQYRDQPRPSFREGYGQAYR